MTDANFFEQSGRTQRQAPLRDKLAGILDSCFEWFVSRRVPVGYQDQTGFHYGIEQVPKASLTWRWFSVEKDDGGSGSGWLDAGADSGGYRMRF